MLNTTLLPIYVWLRPNLQPITPDVLNAWNESVVLPLHNCYSFALGALGVGWCNTGQLQNRTKRTNTSSKKFTPRIQKKYLCDDSLIPIKSHSLDPSKHHIVACFTKPNEDYHFYRLCAEFGWCTKKGIDKAEHIGQGELIPLARVDAPAYKDFVGYFKIPETGIIVERESHYALDTWLKNNNITFESVVNPPRL